MAEFGLFTFKEEKTLYPYKASDNSHQGMLRFSPNSPYSFRYSWFDPNFYEIHLYGDVYAKIHKSDVEVSDPETIQISWSYEDVLQALDKEEPDADDIAYAKKMLGYAAENHDANNGISWDTFRDYDIIGI